MVKDLDFTIPYSKTLKVPQQQEGSTEEEAMKNMEPFSAIELDKEFAEFARYSYWKTNTWKNHCKQMAEQNARLEEMNKTLQHSMQQNLAFQTQQQRVLLDELANLKATNVQLQNKLESLEVTVHELEIQNRMLLKQNVELLAHKTAHFKRL